MIKDISKKKLKEMLAAAYEAGWRGSLELKEEYAELMVEEDTSELEMVEEKKPVMNYDMGTITISSSFLSGSDADNVWTVVNHQRNLLREGEDHFVETV